MPDDQAKDAGIVEGLVPRPGRCLDPPVLVDLDLIGDVGRIDFRRWRGRSTGFSRELVSAAASAATSLSSVGKAALVGEQRFA
jgi:hypothetical protein